MFNFLKKLLKTSRPEPEIYRGNIYKFIEKDLEKIKDKNLNIIEISSLTSVRYILEYDLFPYYDFLYIILNINEIKIKIIFFPDDYGLIKIDNNYFNRGCDDWTEEMEYCYEYSLKIMEIIKIFFEKIKKENKTSEEKLRMGIQTKLKEAFRMD